VLGSITGGTDICSLVRPRNHTVPDHQFAGINTALPVYRGEIQCRNLGMDVKVLGEDSKPVAVGEAGELVCATAFPCMVRPLWRAR